MNYIRLWTPNDEPWKPESGTLSLTASKLLEATMDPPPKHQTFPANMTLLCDLVFDNWAYTCILLLISFVTLFNLPAALTVVAVLHCALTSFLPVSWLCVCSLPQSCASTAVTRYYLPDYLLGLFYQLTHLQ